MNNRMLACVALLWFTTAGRADDSARVGPTGDGAYLVTTRQTIRPAGQSVEYAGRPLDLAVAPDGRTVYVKSNVSVLAIDVASWKLRQELKFDRPGGSMAGIAVSSDGASVYLTAAGSRLLEARAAADGTLAWVRTISVPAANGPKGAESYPCGIALSPDGKYALVCQSINNAIAEVDLEAGQLTRTIPVGNAPLNVLVSRDRNAVYVSNWGGRRARAGDKTNDSAGTPIVVDNRGIASTGSVGVIDPEETRMTAEIAVGLHPNALAMSPDGARLYVANANSDSVSVVDTGTSAVIETLSIKPDPGLPWGSSPTGLAITPDGGTLLVSLGGMNAVAVVDLKTPGGGAAVRGYIPAGWFPSAVATDGKHAFITNVKGVGSRNPAAEGKWNSHSYWGTITKVALPDVDQLAAYTGQAKRDALVPQALRAWEKAQSGARPAAIPQRAGEPSLIEHVIYIIKENRTYDQVLGDLKQGNGDANLCTFGRQVTPNHHALAEQFVLLDNFYCNGVLSADGHAWSTEGYAVDYLEKAGAWARSYPFSGDDALAFAPTGFIWDNALLHGLSFRNFGEFAKTEVTPSGRGIDILRDYQTRGGKYKYTHTIALEPLRQYTNPEAAGWSMRIPDQQRADAFISELKEWETKGTFPNLTIIFLPCDHTAGTSPGSLSPTSMVADNDLALGRIVDAVSHSKFWPRTAIFVIEDDPQAGFDHVDGHRSICLVASPHARRGAVVSKFYNQTSVLHTMELILGLPPMNHMDASAPVMRECFTDQPDLSPYRHLPNDTPLDTLNPPKAALKGLELELAELSEQQNFDEPDAAHEDSLNRILWHATMGYATAYPADLAGAHGKGLKQLNLKLDGTIREDDDD